MRTSRASAGPFSQRVYFTLEEIESICHDELQRVDLLPSSPEPVRIDRFIEKRFVIVPRYDELPDGILGYTKFGSDGVEEIVVSRSLAEDSATSADRVVRTTLAHESGHCLLHTHLFALDATRGRLALSESDEDQDPEKVLCRPVTVDGVGRSTHKYDGKWWEYQANRAIGGLLLPRNLVLEAVGPFLQKSGPFGVPDLAESARAGATAALTDIFDVNAVVARIRLDEIVPPRSGQLSF